MVKCEATLTDGKVARNGKVYPSELYAKCNEAAPVQVRYRGMVYFEAVRRRNGYKDSEIDLVCRSYGNEYDRDSFKPRVNPDIYYSAIRASKWYKNQVRRNRIKDKTPACKKTVSRSFHVRKRPLHCE